MKTSFHNTSAGGGGISTTLFRYIPTKTSEPLLAPVGAKQRKSALNGRGIDLNDSRSSRTPPVIDHDKNHFLQGVEQQHAETNPNLLKQRAKISSNSELHTGIPEIHLSVTQAVATIPFRAGSRPTRGFSQLGPRCSTSRLFAKKTAKHKNKNGSARNTGKRRNNPPGSGEADGAGSFAPPGVGPMGVGRTAA